MNSDIGDLSGGYNRDLEAPGRLTGDLTPQQNKALEESNGENEG